MRNRTLLPLCLLSCAAFLAGCSNFATTAVTDPAQSQGSVTGTIYGGQQPIANATVTLWAAGNTGYGSAATQLATTTSTATGSFSFGTGSGNTYTCPANNSATASQSIYITSVGGQPTTGVTNTSAALMVALGDCLSIKSLNPNVNINELTTVASITALQQFFTPSSSGLGNIGTSPTNALGLANAMRSVANLVNTATGNSFASTTIAGAVAGYTTNPVVTVTPEQSKLNTMADILAACINSATGSTPCNTLFGNVGNTAKDTLQAAYDMASLPSGTGSSASCNGVTTATSICNLYALASSMSPFQPTLASAPTDWTIGVTYSSASTLLGLPPQPASVPRRRLARQHLGRQQQLQHRRCRRQQRHRAQPRRRSRGTGPHRPRPACLPHQHRRRPLQQPLRRQLRHRRSRQLRRRVQRHYPLRRNLPPPQHRPARHGQ
jgi:hypothetical protein